MAEVKSRKKGLFFAFLMVTFSLKPYSLISPPPQASFSQEKRPAIFATSKFIILHTEKAHWLWDWSKEKWFSLSFPEKFCYCLNQLKGSDGIWSFAYPSPWDAENHRLVIWGLRSEESRLYWGESQEGWIFHGDTRTLEEVTKENVPFPRHHHAVLLFPHGFLIYGGYTKSAVVYPAPPLFSTFLLWLFEPAPRQEHPGTPLPDGAFYSFAKRKWLSFQGPLEWALKGATKWKNLAVFHMYKGKNQSRKEAIFLLNTKTWQWEGPFILPKITYQYIAIPSGNGFVFWPYRQRERGEEENPPVYAFLLPQRTWKTYRFKASPYLIKWSESYSDYHVLLQKDKLFVLKNFENPEDPKRDGENARVYSLEKGIWYYFYLPKEISQWRRRIIHRVQVTSKWLIFNAQKQQKSLAVIFQPVWPKVPPIPFRPWLGDPYHDWRHSFSTYVHGILYGFNCPEGSPCAAFQYSPKTQKVEVLSMISPPVISPAAYLTHHDHSFYIFERNGTIHKMPLRTRRWKKLKIKVPLIKDKKGDQVFNAKVFSQNMIIRTQRQILLWKDGSFRSIPWDDDGALGYVFWYDLDGIYSLKTYWRADTRKGMEGYAIFFTPFSTQKTQTLHLHPFREEEYTVRIHYGEKLLLIIHQKKRTPEEAFLYKLGQGNPQPVPLTPHVKRCLKDSNAKIYLSKEGIFLIACLLSRYQEIVTYSFKKGLWEVLKRQRLGRGEECYRFPFTVGPLVWLSPHKSHLPFLECNLQTLQCRPNPLKDVTEIPSSDKLDGR